MSLMILLYVLIFCFVHYATAIFLRRNKGIRYDKKTLVATTFLGLISTVYYFFLDLSRDAETATEKAPEKSITEQHSISDLKALIEIH